MIRVRATLRGISPLLMNPMTDEVLEGIRTRTSSPKRTDWTPEEEAKTKLYRNENGAIGIPSLNLFASLVEAGRRVKVNAKQISTAESTILPSFLSIEEFFLPFKGDPEWVVDKRRGTNEKKQAICLVRPRFNTWEFNVTFKINETKVNEETVRKLVEVSGDEIGLCDFRPTCKGPFGRFATAKWSRLKGDDSQDGKVTVSERVLETATA